MGSIGPTSATASSHREAPLIADDPAADNTDVYAFVSPDKPDTVTIIANYIPFEDPAGGPNYYRFDPTVRYELNVDNNGRRARGRHVPVPVQDTVANPNTFLYNTGQVTSPTDPDLNVKQTYSVTRVTPSRLDRARLEHPGAACEHRAALEPDLRRVPGRRRSRRRPEGVRRAA